MPHRLLALAAALPLSLMACGGPPAAPPVPDTAPPRAEPPAPALPVITEAPIRTGEPALVVQRGLYSYASVIRVNRSGTIAAVVDQSDDVRIFDARTAEERAILRGHTGLVRDVDIAPAGDRLVSASSDGTARIWDLTTGAEVRTFFEKGRVYHARFSPDGKTIATAHPGVVRLWDASFQQRAELPASGAELAFSPDGGALVTWERDADSAKAITVWDVATGAVRFRVPEGDRIHREATWSPDGRLLAWSRGAHDVVISDAMTGAVVREFRTARTIGQIVFSPDGRRLGTGDDQNTVHVYDLATGMAVASIRGKNRSRFAFSPDGVTLAVQQGEDLVLHSLTAGTELRRLRGSDSWVTAFLFTPDGERILGGAGIHQSELVVWDARSGERRTAQRPGHSERKVAWNGDGKLLATAGFARTTGPREEQAVRLWDTESGALRSTLRRPPGAPPLLSDYHHVAASVDGTRVAASNMETATLWDATNSRFIADLDRDSDYHTEHGLAFDPRGKLVATTGGRRAEVRLWDARTGKKLRAFPSTLPVAWTLAFRPDGAVLAVGGAGQAVLFDARSGGKLKTLPGPPGGVMEVSWAPDGKTLAVASTKAIHLYDPTKGDLLGTIPYHDGRLTSHAWRG